MARTSVAAAPNPRSLYRTLQLCSGGGGFEAIPLAPMHVDLAKVRARLEAAGVPVVDARVMVIASLEAEATILGQGRILIKSKDPAVAERTFDRVLAIVAP